MSSDYELQNERREYALADLNRAALHQNPFIQFKKWLQEIRDCPHKSLQDPTAMVLATVNALNQPSQRIVLLKGVDEQGLVFYTNYNSQKACDLAHNPNAALLFHWLELERQVRIQGVVEKVSRQKSCDYFTHRPRGSQLAALTSDQSQPIASRELLEKKYQILEQQYQDKTIETPEHWGGYRLVPNQFEFWQGGEMRLHDRFRYQLTERSWQITRLQP